MLISTFTNMFNIKSCKLTDAPWTNMNIIISINMNKIYTNLLLVHVSVSTILLLFYILAYLLYEYIDKATSSHHHQLFCWF